MEVTKFKDALNNCRSFSEITKLWRSTSIPYDMPKLEPFSEQYKCWQLDLYKSLTGKTYSITNEMTSSKQTFEEFEVGYPWITKDLGVISTNFVKIAQALLALAENKKSNMPLNVIEYGSGWGNLAIAIAKSGDRVTCVDIDQGFLERIHRISHKEGLAIELIHSDFESVSEKTNNKRFDCVIFQSLFHHCINFEQLLLSIQKKILNTSGEILFFSEPVFPNWRFPWGLRFDGESLWAITCNFWLELGFDLDFFSLLCLNNGFFISKINGIEPFVGDGYRATQVHNGINFNNWIFPHKYYHTWHFDSNKTGYAFSKKISILPGLANLRTHSKCYNIELVNYAPHDLVIEVEAEKKMTLTIETNNRKKLFSIPADCTEVIFNVETYMPAQLINNGDTRDLGFSVHNIAIL